MPSARIIASRMLVRTRTREKLCTSCTPDAGGRNKVCKTARVTARTTRETSDYDPATARVSPATRQTTRATRRVPPPTLRRREETYQVRRGNGRPVPGNTPEDVGNVPSAISHSSTRPRQHRGSDLPQLGRVKNRTEGGAATAPDTAFHLGSTRHLIEANIYSPRQDPGC